MRFLDAHEGGAPHGDKYAVVTRTAQGDDTQKWLIKATGAGSHTVQQKSNMRFLDSYGGGDCRAVTREFQGDDTQKWVFKATADGEYTIQAKFNMRFLDAHEDDKNDYAACTRPDEGNDSQKWVLEKIAGRPAEPPPTEGWEKHEGKDILPGHDHSHISMKGKDVEEVKRECISKGCFTFVIAKG